MPPRKTAPVPPAAPQVRTDALDSAILGAVANMITGAGQTDDPTTGWAPALGGRELWPAELQKLSENGLGDLTVSLKPLWISCAGVRVDLDGDLRPAPHRAAAIMARRDIGDDERADLLTGGKALLERHLLDLGARDAFRVAHKHARQMGGGGVLLRTYPQQRLDQPLDLDGRKIVGLVPMSGYHLRVKEIGRNPLSSRYGLPTVYAIDHTGGSGEWWASDVHWSHVLDFYGVRRLVPELSLHAWSQWPAVSSLQACWDALRGLYAAALNNEDAQRRMSVFVVKYPNFAAAMGNNPDAFVQLLTSISQKIGVRGTYNAPPGGDVDTASLSLSGMGEINSWFMQMYATYERVPYGLLWDAGGSGLSKDTLIWDAWTTTLTGEFAEAGYAAAYKRLIDYVAPDVYASRPIVVRIEPGDFRQPSDRERMELRQMGATEAATVIAAGIAPPEAFEEARYRGTYQTDVRVPKGWRKPADGAAPVSVEKAPPIALTSTDIASIVTVDEARASQGLSPIGPPDGTLTVSQYQAKYAATVATAAAAAAGETAPAEPPPPDPAAATDAAPDSPDDIPNDTSAEDFAAAMTASGFTACEHGKKNRCLLCGIERVREVQAGEDGSPVFGVRWRAIRTDAAEYTIPAGARGNARKVLEWREKHGSAVRGMTETGWRRARQLARGGSISAGDVREIRAWFARHGAQKATRAVDPKFKGEPWRDAGYVSWLGWGGDTMRAYVSDLRADADFSGTSYLWLPVPETERAAAVQRAAAEIVDLEGYAPGDPMPAVYHVTALYLGETSRARAREVQTRAPLAADGPILLRPVRVGTFPAQDDGRSPVYIEIESTEVSALNARLRDLLAPLPPPKHTPFVAHVTIGFARLTPEIAESLASIPVPADLGESAELRFTFDGRDTVWPL